MSATPVTPKFEKTPRNYLGLLANALAALGLASLMPMESEAIIRVLSGEGLGAMAQSQMWMLVLMMACQGVLVVLFLLAMYGYMTNGKLPPVSVVAPLVILLAVARISIALDNGGWRWPLTETELYLMILFIAALVTLHPSFRTHKREDKP